MTDTEALWCVVPAAGRGARFGGERPKQYADLGGKPLLLRTLERLAAHPRIAGLIVVLASDDAFWPTLFSSSSTMDGPVAFSPLVPSGERDGARGCAGTLSGKPLHTATGGIERADSVLAGLRTLPADVGDDAFVLIHDAARPCVLGEDIERLIALGVPAGGALLAVPLRDTLKRADGARRVAATEPREARWRALTPQLFRRGELAAALERARAAGIAITDEAMAMEHDGCRPLLVEGAESNIKVTTRGDLALADYLLSRESGIGNRES